MKSKFEMLQARKDLDTYLKKLRRIGKSQSPRPWIRDIREALGMTSVQFARRLGVKQPSVAALERSERLETIKIATLRKAARALGCKLLYALVPDMPLSTILRQRQCKLAERDLNAKYPGFEKFTTLQRVFAIDKAAREVPEKRVWEEETDNPNIK